MKTQKRSTLYQTLQKYFWMLVICIQLHQMLFAGSTLAHKVHGTTRGAGCPFLATHRYLAKIVSTSTMETSVSMEAGGSIIPGAVSQPSFLPRHNGASRLMMASRFVQESERYSFSAELFDRTPFGPDPWRTSPMFKGHRYDFKRFSSSTEDPPEANLAKAKSLRMKKVSPGELDLVVLGLSHHNAKVETREKLAIPEFDWNKVSKELTDLDSVYEAAVLSTCNRFEVYFAAKSSDIYEGIHDVLKYLHKRTNETIDLATLREQLFILSGDDAVHHLLTVASGLDSLVIGEGQILAQVKRAHEHATNVDEGYGGALVSKLLHTAIATGKRVRSETKISKGSVSISSAAVEFAMANLGKDCQLSSIDKANIAIIGAGKMSRLLLVHLDSQGVKHVKIVNRSPDRVEELRREFPSMELEYVPFDERYETIRDADIVFPSTASETTIIDHDPLEQALSQRTKLNGLQIIDISVPRNVEHSCETIARVHSYNVDDLKAVVQGNTAKRKHEMKEAQGIILEESSRFKSWKQSLHAVPIINKLQEKAESLRSMEMKRIAVSLQNLTESEIQVVDRMSKGIIAKLLHGPMTHLRSQTEPDHVRSAIKHVSQAFSL